MAMNGHAQGPKIFPPKYKALPLSKAPLPKPRPVKRTIHEVTHPAIPPKGQMARHPQPPTAPPPPQSPLAKAAPQAAAPKMGGAKPKPPSGPPPPLQQSAGAAAPPNSRPLPAPPLLKEMPSRHSLPPPPAVPKSVPGGSAKGPHPPAFPPPGLTASSPQRPGTTATATAAPGAVRIVPVQRPLSAPPPRVRYVPLRPPPKFAPMPPPATATAAVQSAAEAVPLTTSRKSGLSSAQTSENKQIKKMQKVEAHTKDLLYELTTLDPARKQEAFAFVAARFLEKTDRENLDLFIAKMVGNGGANAEDNKDDHDQQHEAEEQQGVQQEWQDGGDEQLETADQDESTIIIDEDDAEGDETAPYWEELRDFLATQGEAQPVELMQAWNRLSFTQENTPEGLQTLYQVAMTGEFEDLGLQVCAVLTMELLKAHKVTVDTVVEILAVLGQTMDEAVQEFEGAWCLYPYIITLMFPKTFSATPWGLLMKSWRWTNWYEMVETVLATFDKTRSFDILVYVLQLLQEKSSNIAIKDQKVWNEEQRIPRVLALLGKYGDMSPEALSETLEQYEVLL